MGIKKIIRAVFLWIPYIILCFIIVLSILAPILEYQRLQVSSKLYGILRNICHQVPTRCLWIKTSNMGLCARCFSVYLSLFLVGLYLMKYNIKRIFWKYSFILIIPCIIDGSSQYLNLRLSNNTLRAITGGLAGIGLGLILFPLYFRLLDLITERS